MRDVFCNSGTYSSRKKKLSKRGFGVVNVGENDNADPVSNNVLLVNPTTEA